MSTLEDQDAGSNDAAVVRSEEHLHLGTALQEAGRLIVRKLVGERHDTSEVDRDVEHVEVEHTDAEAEDSGEIITLPDGSLSIPVFEEEIVVRKRLVVRERIVLRKYTVTETQVVEGDVRVERIEIVPGDEVADRVDADGDAAELVVAHATATHDDAPTDASTPADVHPSPATTPVPVPPDPDTAAELAPVPATPTAPAKRNGARTGARKTSSAARTNSSAPRSDNRKRDNDEHQR